MTKSELRAMLAADKAKFLKSGGCIEGIPEGNALGAQKQFVGGGYATIGNARKPKQTKQTN